MVTPEASNTVRVVEDKMGTLGKYISIDPSIHAGLPCVVGTRVTVAEVLAAVDAGHPVEDISNIYPGIGPSAVKACMACRDTAPAPGTGRSLLVECDAVAQQ